MPREHRPLDIVGRESGKFKNGARRQSNSAQRLGRWRASSKLFLYGVIRSPTHRMAGRGNSPLRLPHRPVLREKIVSRVTYSGSYVRSASELYFAPTFECGRIDIRAIYETKSTKNKTRSPHEAKLGAFPYLFLPAFSTSRSRRASERALRA